MKHFRCRFHRAKAEASSVASEPIVTAPDAAPHLDDLFFMPTPESQRRLQFFLAAAKAAGSPEFNGLVLMSLLLYIDDATLHEAVSDAIRTLSGGAA